MSPLIAVNNISVSLSGRRILDEVSFSVTRGEVIGILGPNGAGKTTLFRCLLAQLPYSGIITLDGRNIQQLSGRDIARVIAIVHQQHHASFDLTVEDVVGLGLIPNEAFFSTGIVRSRTQKQTIDDALCKVGLTDFREQYFHRLSGGEQQRAMIARALVQGADILLLDEPTNHLDIYYQHQLLHLIRQLNFTVLMTVHDLNLAAHYCQRVLLLQSGQLIEDGSPEHVFEAKTLSAAFGLHCDVVRDKVTDRLMIHFYPDALS